MVERRRGKKQQEETEKQQYVIETESNFTTEGVRNIDQNSPTNLTVVSHGIPHTVNDSRLKDPQCHLHSLSSLPDYFRS